MTMPQRLLQTLTAGTALLFAVAAWAQSDLEVTMEVIDDLSEIDDELVAAEVPRETVYEEDLFDLDGDGIPDDQEDETGLFEQYRHGDADFEIADENDGFELEDEEWLSWKEFTTEDDFEEGEKVDGDDYDIIDMDDPMDDPAT